MKPHTKTFPKNDSTATMSGHDSRGKVTVRDINRFRKKILEWYDKHRRDLPWRAPPGQQAHPYHVWLSEIMLQQTVVAAVRPYFIKFIERWPAVEDLAAAPQNDVMQAWAGLGYYARARNLHKCAKVVAQNYKGVFPDREDDLKMLPGIGDYTAAAVAAIAFDRPATVVDGNVERVVARWFDERAPLPGVKKILKARAHELSAGRSDRPGDFAQAMMDLGATICIPKTPRCASCPVQKDCRGRLAGTASALPARTPRRNKPQKWGRVFWITDVRGRVLCQRRPENVMLGGMVGLPTTAWEEKGSPDAENQDLPSFLRKKVFRKLDNVRVAHSFTHFDLTLEAYSLKLKDVSTVPNHGYFWADVEDLSELGFPTLFKKIVKIIGHDKDRE